MAGPAWLTDDSPLPDPHGKGERAVQFLKRLRLHEGRLAGQRFPLSPWQERKVRRVYGDTQPDGRRQIRTVFELLPRGNGKTTIGGGLAGLHLFGPEREAGGQVLAAAADREQASIAFNATLGMIQQDAKLRSITDPAPSQKLIRHPNTRSVYKALSHEAYTKHGLSASFFLADEVHAWPTRELYDVIRGSQGKRDNPLTWIITTAGRGVHGLAYELYTYAKRVAAGEVDDPTFLPILFEPEPGAEWDDEAVWRAVNPALADGFRSLEEMHEKARIAREIPSELTAFKQYYLNMWSDGAADPWIDMGVYDEGAAPIDLDEYTGADCWIGVDLSATSDLTCVSAVFAPPEGGYAVLPHFFLPAETVQRIIDRTNVPWRQWIDAGFLTVTPGPVVDYDIVEQCIYDLAERFHVREIPMDRWNSTGTASRLMSAGLPVVLFGQGFASMSPACKEVERAILAREFQHGGHPVLRWCFQNVAIARDGADNIKFDKAKSADKIDGAVATAMAIARAAATDTGPSVYSTEDRPEGIVFV